MVYRGPLRPRLSVAHRSWTPGPRPATPSRGAGKNAVTRQRRVVLVTDLGVADDGVVSIEEIELEFSRALDLVGQNYREVVELAANAPGRDEAIRLVRERFQISEQSARAVLGLRLEQLTVAARKAMHVRYEAAAAE